LKATGDDPDPSIKEKSSRATASGIPASDPRQTKRRRQKTSPGNLPHTASARVLGDVLPHHLDDHQHAGNLHRSHDDDQAFKKLIHKLISLPNFAEKQASPKSPVTKN
jgi:hypothetical protein